MTLTVLRRFVLACSSASLLASGGAAWYSTQPEASTRPREEWDRLFPVKSSGGPEAVGKGPGPQTEYVAAAGWVQGEKPKKAEAAPVAAPPPDPFQYRLNGVIAGRSRLESYAQIQSTNPPGPAFSIGVGEQVPADPGGEKGKVREWRLDDVALSDGKRPASATFHNLDTEEERVLTVEVAFEIGRAHV